MPSPMRRRSFIPRRWRLPDAAAERVNIPLTCCKSDANNSILGRFAQDRRPCSSWMKRTRTIIRERMRRRTRTGLAMAVLVALLAVVGCGASASESSELTAQIRKALDRHPGFAVRSVHCPSDIHRAKGVVTHCLATLRDGHVVALRATQLDSKGTINLIANEMFADNVEHGIVSSCRSRRPRRMRPARTTCRSSSVTPSPARSPAPAATPMPASRSSTAMGASD